MYTGDCEFNLDSIEKILAYRNFFEKADVLVFDTQYTIKEAMDKYSWGHSSSSIAIDIAGKFHVKRLILFHHEPGYDDEQLDQVLITAKSYLNMNAGRVGVQFVKGCPNQSPSGRLSKGKGAWRTW